MISQFNKTIKRLFLKNKKIFLILGDIGVYSFKDLLKNKRAINIGILEQASISFASGLSKIGFVPIFHTIATFMVGRAFEQLKLDFGYYLIILLNHQIQRPWPGFLIHPSTTEQQLPQ